MVLRLHVIGRILVVGNERPHHFLARLAAASYRGARFQFNRPFVLPSSAYRVVDAGGNDRLGDISSTFGHDSSAPPSFIWTSTLRVDGVAMDPLPDNNNCFWSVHWSGFADPIDGRQIYGILGHTETPRSYSKCTIR